MKTLVFYSLSINKMIAKLFITLYDLCVCRRTTQVDD